MRLNAGEAGRILVKYKVRSVEELEEMIREDRVSEHPA